MPAHVLFGSCSLGARLPEQRISSSCTVRANIGSPESSSALRKNPDLYSPTTATETTQEAPHPTTTITVEKPNPHLNFTPLHVKHRPEVLSPAGGWPQLTAAVENGADAVYFGVGDLNARARASNFTAEELPQVMEYLHTRGVKGYLVLNVLIFDDELEILAEKAQHAARSGVDAVIVQDIGAVEIITKAAPGLAIHGSTQMTITSAEGAAFAGSRGIERVVVGRELSVRDIASVAGAPTNGPEVEAFVHGALCVSYSGQCFSSEAWGGRSANRGQCAQACRLDYGLVLDGQLKYLGDVQYLLSPQDLSAVELVPQLMLAGVTSFKIEGRLKGPEYVAMTTRVYRQAVDAAWNAYSENKLENNNRNTIAAEESNSNMNGITTTNLDSVPEYKLNPISQLELQQVFARGQDSQYSGLTPGFLEGPQHQMLVRGRAPRHRGVFIGHVERVISSGNKYNSSWSVVLRLAAPVRRGDGIVFDQGNPQDEEFGGAIYEIKILDSSSSQQKQQYQQENRNGKNNTNNATQRSSSGKSSNRNNSAPAGSGGRSVLEAEEGSLVEIVLGSGPNLSSSSSTSGIKPGDLIWKNKDPVLESKLKSSFENISAADRRRVSVTVHVTAALGNPLKISLIDEKGRKSEAETSLILENATGRPLAAADVEKAVGVHLGDEGSLFAAKFDFSQCEFEQGLFISPGAIKDARRSAVAALLEQQLEAPAMIVAEAAGNSEFLQADDVLVEMRQSIATESRHWADQKTSESREAASMLRVLCRTKAQVDAAVQVPWLTEIVLDFLEVHGLKEACESVRQAGKRVVVASPRILKPDEKRLWIFYLRLGADALLVRSAGLLHQLMQAGGPGAVVPGAEGHPIPVLEGDFSLNAANIISADVLLGSGLARLAPTHDCNADQLAALARGLGPRGRCLEAILHQNLPIFHTEHCIFARFLSTGNSYLDCGHPCEHHTVHLRGSEGTDHLVLADMGCRNTVFDGSAQSGLPFIDNLLKAGFGCFRIELVDQSPNMVVPLLEGYKTALEDALNKSSASSNDSGRANSGIAANNNKFENLEQEQQRVENSRKALWKWMDEKLTDANGRAQGVGTGSLQPRNERGVSTMKQTAAAKRAAASTALKKTNFTSNIH